MRRPGGVGAEDDAFEDLVRIAFHLHAVDERARLALVGIDAEIDRARGGPWAGTTTSSRWGSRPRRGRAARWRGRMPQHVVRAHFLQRLAQRAVPAAGLVDGQRVAVLLVNVRQQYGFVRAWGQGLGI